ncbi:MAG: enoyl-CoA hydratase [Actinomycetota bacterium]|nr:enoyl-CoA hydratase [Actinomycetota bacterium]MDA8397987.1 enoyl-CoA hydratase [Actinomycetota bacterium]
MQTLLVTRPHEAVLEITLNRPAKKNAINSEMWAELGEVLRHARDDRSLRVLVLGGAGGAFCSGADLSGTNLANTDTLSRMRSINEVALLLHNLPKPTIAKVSGIAAGAGCNMALGCDIIIASTSARFSEIFVRRGLSVDFGGSFLLPRLIGMHKAKELALTGEIIDAATASELGLVNRVVEDEELDRVVAEMAERLAGGPPIAMGLTKALLNESLGRTMEEALEAEAMSQTINGRTADSREAINAFLEKRAPHFVGE